MSLGATSTVEPTPSVFSSSENVFSEGILTPVPGIRKVCDWRGCGLGLGTATPWRGERRPVDFLDLKGLVESVTEDLDPGFHSGAHPLMRVGHCAELSIGGETAGNLGECSHNLRRSI